MDLCLRDEKESAAKRSQILARKTMNWFVYGPHHGMVSMLRSSVPAGLLVFWQHKTGPKSEVA